MEPAAPVCKIRPRCPPAELEPLLAHLSENRPIAERTSFPRGTLLQDGRLDLCKQALGPEGLGRVAEALAGNTQVAHLLLGADQLGPEGAMIVADLARHHPSIETLYLGCNGIGPYGVRALADALADNDRVHALWLKRNALGVGGAAEVSRLLRANGRIRTLDLVSNGLGIEGARLVCEALVDHPLENLYLCGNELGPEGAAMVSELLERSDGLRRLYLATNGIGDAGAAALARAIEGRAGLRVLGLSSDDIGSEGAIALARAVAGHPTLEQLELGFARSTAVVGAEANRLGDAGARAFVQVLESGGVLTALDLSGNGITHPAAAELVAALASNTRITKLAIGNLPRNLKQSLNGLLCRNANAAGPRREEPHLSSIRSVYRTAATRSEPPVEPEREPRRSTEAERGFSDAELETCLKVLEALSIRRGVLDELGEVRDLMTRMLRTARPAKRRRSRQDDRPLLDRTGIRRKTGTTIEIEVPPEGPRALTSSRTCYVCKSAFTALHHFYDSFCPSCAEVSWEKRLATADLSGRVALVTGGRIKAGIQIVLKLLRAGAEVIATTRFPHDAARRYAAEPDFEGFAGRLRIHQLDLLQLGHVEAFATRLAEREPRLDILINNAAQTLYRPQAFYAPMRALEAAALPASLLRLIDRPHPGALQLAEPGDARLFPAQSDDGHGQPVDLRSRNSWRLRLHEVGTRELISVNLINTVAPYLLIAKLRERMAKTPGDKFVINVSAVEGQFERRNKTFFHPHTNMAKAALNMITRTSAPDLALEHIYLASVDPGWFSNENPHPIAEGMKASGFTLPIDEIDGAARVLDPIFSRINGGDPLYGCLLKDYRPAPW